MLAKLILETRNKIPSFVSIAIPVHTIDRCYELHGYLPSHPKHNSSRRVANDVHIQNTEAHLGTFNPAFTYEQYLMTLINEEEQDHLKFFS